MNRPLTAVLGFNLASLSQLRHGATRPLLRACLEAFHAATDLRTVPEIPLDDILGERRAAVRFTVQRYEDGSLQSQEAMTLLSILVADSPAEVLEIGTYMGRTTVMMAENLPTATIHTIDLPPQFSTAADNETGLQKDDFHLIDNRNVGREFREKEAASRIVQHLGDTAQLDFSVAGRPTFYFIDGSHTYEYCKNDSDKCFALCGGRGTFLWHDCNRSHPGVTRFISEWRQKGRDIKRIAGTSIAYWKGK